VQDSGTPHMVRVNHQGVNYFPSGGPVMPGTSSVDIQVYDAAKSLPDVATTIQVMRVQTDGSNLQVVELIAVTNNSKPPRSLMNDRPFQFYLPEGAQIDGADAQAPGGMPVNTAPVPDTNNKYYFVFPLRPGETRFQIGYHLPYSGQATLTPKVAGNMQHFAVILPKSMQFQPKVEGTYSPMNDQSGQSNIQVATDVSPAKDLSFQVSGTGVLQDDQQGGQGGGGGAAAAQGRPGGGLGTPEGTPDPLQKYRWPILAGLAVALAVAGGYIASRPKPAAPAAEGAQAVAVRATAAPAVAAPANGANRNTALLDALKEELFQLEMDRQQGKVSETEYAQAKSGLDQALRRAVSRAKETSAT
ncbi:MAG TPA: carboxypeptidase regulatory-like domain-containing protein, partial [Terriglobales bacterium]|nr:carboxypeptidase regulatory-like domain-containing protein [Terriglobales bacterium]